MNGGQRGIRTLGRVSPTHAFQACTFNHSVTCPLEGGLYNHAPSKSKPKPLEIFGLLRKTGKAPSPVRASDDNIGNRRRRHVAQFVRRCSARPAQIEGEQQSDEQLRQGIGIRRRADATATLGGVEEGGKAPVEVRRLFRRLIENMPLTIEHQAQAQGFTPVGSRAGFATGGIGVS